MLTNSQQRVDALTVRYRSAYYRYSILYERQQFHWIADPRKMGEQGDIRQSPAKRMLTHSLFAIEAPPIDTTSFTSASSFTGLQSLQKKGRREENGTYVRQMLTRVLTVRHSSTLPMRRPPQAPVSSLGRRSSKDRRASAARLHEPMCN